jgi:hypothetical protein
MSQNECEFKSAPNFFMADYLPAAGKKEVNGIGEQFANGGAT